MPDGLGHNMGIPTSAQISVPADLLLPLQRLLPSSEPGFGNYHRRTPPLLSLCRVLVWESWTSIQEAHAYSLLPRPSFRLDSQTGVHSPPFQLWSDVVPPTLLDRSPRILPRIGLCMGTDTKGIHGHCTSCPTSNTSTLQHTQMEKGCQAPSCCSQPLWQTGTRQMGKDIE